MLNLSSIIKQAEARFQNELEDADRSKGVDKARIERRNNETYFTRVTRACLPRPENYELTDTCYSLCVAVPELLFSKMYYLGWGQGRKQKDVEQDAPILMSEYREMFNDSTQLKDIKTLVDEIRKKSINYSLICHGLSPTADTLLLLADIGRSLRISYALGIMDVQVLLADISWMKYNRSIRQLMDANKFIDKLRICIDKRQRLYNAIGLSYRVFGISDYGSPESNINKTDLEKRAKSFRQLAEVLWGEKSLNPHDSQMKNIIGTSLHGIKRGDSNHPPYISTLISFENVASALEKALENQLNVLRTISSLFSTFDEEIFIYYFAQYYAQKRYDRYLKIAPHSESKFDGPFNTLSRDFDLLTRSKSKTTPENEVRKESSDTTDINFHIYLPQYKLGYYEILPYTSVSGDVIRNDVPLSEFLDRSILLDDAYNSNIDKIFRVVSETPIPSRNRIIADLLSFIHILSNKAPTVKDRSTLIRCIAELNIAIADQLFSKVDSSSDYQDIYASWLKAIQSEKSTPPFHIIPYLWEEKDWDENRLRNSSVMINELLQIVRAITE